MEIKIDKELIENKDTIVKYIFKEVSDYTKVHVDNITKNTRKREFVFARQLCAYLICLIYKESISLGEIGKYFNRNNSPYDHATILHCITVINNLNDIDRKFKIDLEKLEKRVNEFADSYKPSFDLRKLIRQKLKEKGLSQRAFGRLGIVKSRDGIASYLNKRSNLGFKLARAIHNVLEINPEILFRHLD